MYSVRYVCTGGSFPRFAFSLLDHTHRFSDTCLPTGVQPKSEFELRCFLMHCGWWLLEWSSRDLTILSDTHRAKLWLSCVSLIELHSFAQYANVFSRHNKNRITMEKREWWFCKKKKKNCDEIILVMDWWYFLTWCPFSSCVSSAWMILTTKISLIAYVHVIIA